MSDDFKTVPTPKQLAVTVARIHNELRQLGAAVGETVANLEHSVQENNKVTDQVLEEMSLQIAFLMSQIRFRTPLHGGIAGPDGKVPVEVKTASQAYMDGGRAKLLAVREEYKRAQGLSAAEGQASDPAAFDGTETLNGQTRHDFIGDDESDPAETKH